MKDMLGRDIMVGDTIASAVPTKHGAELCLYKVLAVSPFALQMVNTQVEGATPFVLSDTSHTAIADWAKGADAAK